MKMPGSVYRRKRNRILGLYLLTLVGSLLLGTAFLALWEWLSWGVLYGISMGFIMVCSLCAIALVPLAIWALTQTMKAKAEDRLFIQKHSREPAPVLVDSAGERVSAPRRPVPYPYQGREDKGPWWSVLFLLFMLPPLGLCFVLYKLYQEPQHALDNAIVTRAAGWVFLAFSALEAVVIIAMELAAGEQLVTLLLCLVGIPAVCSGILLAAAAHVDRQARRLARLQHLVFVEACLSIDDLSRRMRMPYGQTVRLLQFHIDRKEFFSCFLDFEARQIVAPDHLPKAATRCRHCGGTTVHIKNIPALCDYCGRVLK